MFGSRKTTSTFRDNIVSSCVHDVRLIFSKAGIALLRLPVETLRIPTIQLIRDLIVRRSLYLGPSTITKEAVSSAFWSMPEIVPSQSSAKPLCLYQGQA